MAGNSKLRLHLDGDVLLTKKSLPIKKITTKHKALALEMVKLMKQWNGVGLSAPQVGRLLRLIVIGTKDVSRIMFNPQLLAFEGEPITKIEGCLSYPGRYKYRSRPNSVTVKYQDVGGVSVTETLSGLAAQIVIHECFHLDGITLMHKDIDNYEKLLYTDSDI